MKIGPTGVWLNASASDHRCDPGLSAALAVYFKANGGNVVDIGCGEGGYVLALRSAGVDCDGYDGSPNTIEMTDGKCQVANFAYPVILPRRYDWALSLEVGEHIPAEFEAVFVGNLITNSKRGAVLSWAVPGQGGVGHVNERSNGYVKNLFAAAGYVNDLTAETHLRSAVTDYCYWFRDTLMVFERVL